MRQLPRSVYLGSRHSRNRFNLPSFSFRSMSNRTGISTQPATSSSTNGLIKSAHAQASIKQG